VVPSSPPPTVSAPARLDALDSLRGLIIVLMALDHASMFVAQHHFAEPWGMALPDYGTPLALLTRLVTHLCAPGFFLLMGAGMALFAASRRTRGWDESRIMRHFLLRGFVLIVVEQLIVNPAWILGALDVMWDGGDLAGPPMPGGGGIPFVNFGVLSALGAAMMLAGLLIRLPAAAVGGTGVALLLLCQVLLPGAEDVAELHPVLARLALVAGQTGPVLVIYPVGPWLAVCLIGIGLGAWLKADTDHALGRMLPIGASLLAVFMAVRMLGAFGTHHPMPTDDWMGLLSVTKYPPSIAFLLLTLGAGCVLLWGLSRAGVSSSAFGRLLRVYGRTPLFFYVVHLYLYALMGLALPGKTSLLGMYPLWLLGVALLYPACTRYARFKESKGETSLWRLF
jgi:uncharacterized membrane protein